MMPAISYGEAHGANWDRPAPPADPADVLATLATLASLAPLERARETEHIGRLVDLELARLTAWKLGQPRYDPTVPPPQSEASRRHQELTDADTIRSWRKD